MKLRRSLFSWSSLKGKMLISFIITALIPSMVLIFFSYMNTSGIVRENAEELLQSNLDQTKSSLDVWMDSYEDILFQIYMNDDIVDMVEHLNHEENATEMTSKLRRTLRGMFYTKDHIKCITVITANGDIIFYDLLTGSATKTSWMANVGMTQKQLYDEISQDNETHIISTEEAGVYASENYYLFHLGHRIIDYQNVKKQLGVVIVSIDEEMLREISAKSESENNVNFIVDTDGKMVSCSDKELLGKEVIRWSNNVQARKEKYEEFLNASDLSQMKPEIVTVTFDEKVGMDIVNVSSQKELLQRLNTQQKIIFFVLGFTTIVLLILIILITRNLMSSINRLVKTMKCAEAGGLSVRTVVDKKTPMEIQTIGNQFNHMMDQLEKSLEKEKTAIASQQKAEIAALEAQINPHFLYNTLDTINWMAIDRDEYEISNSITSLASILRYGIDNSDTVVSVRREVEWLKQYLFLQQTRLKNTFQCEIQISQEVQEWGIHKLLFQPFVENAISHGFQNKAGVHELKISMNAIEERLMIQIYDNGIGISEEMVRKINLGEYPENEDKNCIGMKNAIMRMQMYYKEEAVVEIKSSVGKYTSISINIPKILI